MKNLILREKEKNNLHKKIIHIIRKIRLDPTPSRPQAVHKRRLFMLNPFAILLACLRRAYSDASELFFAKSLIYGSIISLSCIACNKDKLPVSGNNLSALSMLEQEEQQKLIAQLGNYQVTCRLQTTDLILNSAGTYPIEVNIDSLFLDTLAIDLSNDRIYGLFVANQINENTIFLSSELLKNRYKSYFFIDPESDVVSYIDSSDPYMCKCDNKLSFKNDSIFYSYDVQYSYWYSVSCSGVK